MNSNLFAIKHQRSLTTDHYNKFNNSEKVCNTARISKMWHREMKWENAIRKTAPTSLTQCCRKPLLKTHYLWSTKKWSTKKLHTLVSYKH